MDEVIYPPEKMRADSVIGNLEPEIKAQIDEMLLTGSSYRKVQETLGDCGVALSIKSIGKYYNRHLWPIKVISQTKTASEINKLNTEGLDDATVTAVKSTVFDLATRPDADPKKIATLLSLVLQAEKLRLEDRKIALLESKAKAADDAKEIINRNELSPEEKADRIKAIFGM